MSNDDDQLLPLREAAAALGCGYSTLWAAIRDGRLPDIMGPGTQSKGRRAVHYVRLGDARATVTPQPPGPQQREQEYQKWYYLTYTKPRRQAARERARRASG